jgi:hypothetical protein
LSNDISSIMMWRNSLAISHATSRNRPSVAFLKQLVQ